MKMKGFFFRTLCKAIILGFQTIPFVGHVYGNRVLHVNETFSYQSIIQVVFQFQKCFHPEACYLQEKG